MQNQEAQPTVASAAGFRFWTPAPGATIKVGPERRPYLLPELPLPVCCGEREPERNDIGEGLYAFLRQFPEAAAARTYAELLREAFPHYLADLAAQIVMLNEKVVDAPFIERKVTGLKILALLEPGNPALLHHLGASCWELGLMFTELGHCRGHFLAAMGYLQQALAIDPAHLPTLNLLAQIDYWFGDYPTARMRWQKIVDRLSTGTARSALVEKIARIDTQNVPDHPLLDDLETIGRSLELIASHDYAEARALLEGLEQDGTLMAEVPMPEFFAVLGLCREHCGELAGANAAYEQALALDDSCAAALAGQERIAQGGRA